jgi:hypothetical protein
MTAWLRPTHQVFPRPLELEVIGRRVILGQPPYLRAVDEQGGSGSMMSRGEGSSSPASVSSRPQDAPDVQRRDDRPCRETDRLPRRFCGS